MNEFVFLKIAKIANLKKEELTHYESSLKAQRDYFNTISYAEGMALEKGETQTKEKVITNFILKMGVSDRQTAEIADVSIDLVRSS